VELSSRLVHFVLLIGAGREVEVEFFRCAWESIRASLLVTGKHSTNGGGLWAQLEKSHYFFPSCQVMSGGGRWEVDGVCLSYVLGEEILYMEEVRGILMGELSGGGRRRRLEKTYSLMERTLSTIHSNVRQSVSR